MYSKEYVLGAIEICSVIVCKKYKAENVKRIVHDSYVELNVSNNYDICKKALIKAYDSEVIFDGKFKSIVTGNANTKTIRIHIIEI